MYDPFFLDTFLCIEETDLTSDQSIHPSISLSHFTLLRLEPFRFPPYFRIPFRVGVESESPLSPRRTSYRTDTTLDF